MVGAKTETDSYQWCPVGNRQWHKGTIWNIGNSIKTKAKKQTNKQQKRNNAFYFEVNRLPTQVVESPFLEILNTWLDVVQGNLFWLTLFEQGNWTRWPSEVPPSPSNSVIMTNWIDKLEVSEASKRVAKILCLCFIKDCAVSHKICLLSLCSSILTLSTWNL